MRHDWRIFADFAQHLIGIARPLYVGDTLGVDLDGLADMGVILCVAEGVGNKPARWRKTGKAVDELLLPSVATVRAACVPALPGPKSGG